jgi:hypothetical protein
MKSLLIFSIMLLSISCKKEKDNESVLPEMGNTFISFKCNGNLIETGGELKGVKALPSILAGKANNRRDVNHSVGMTFSGFRPDSITAPFQFQYTWESLLPYASAFILTKEDGKYIIYSLESGFVETTIMLDKIDTVNHTLSGIFFGCGNKFESDKDYSSRKYIGPVLITEGKYKVNYKE